MYSSLDYSPFKLKKKEKNFVSSSLKKFSASPLFQISKRDLKSAETIWKSIKKSHSKVFIFAFGGMGSSAKIVNSLFPSKNKNIFLIDVIDEKSLSGLSSLNKTELQSSHSIFISKSGQTKEILFYKSFLKRIYFNKQLSLKGKVTVLTHTLKNPLLKWAKKEGCSVVLSHNSLPGRFSFFSLSGLLQFQAYGFDVSVNMFKNISKAVKTLEFQKASLGLFANTPETIKALEFFIHQCDQRKEIFFCPFDLRLKELSHWLELSWSESLFKKEAERQVPALRNIALSDLRHACIEELIAKKDQVCFWAMDIKSKNKTDSLFYKKQITKLLKSEKIPYMFMQLSLDRQNALARLIVDFYKILFCIGDFSKSDIYTQPWVDYLKRTS